MTLELATPHGPARAHLDLQAQAPGALVLGHGAGGGVAAPDLTAAARAATSLGWSVVLVEQPYRVAGRRSPAPAAQLDAAWTAVVDRLREHELAGLPLVAGGRSSGARVACRTSAATGVVGVLCVRSNAEAIEMLRLHPNPVCILSRGETRNETLNGIPVLHLPRDMRTLLGLIGVSPRGGARKRKRYVHKHVGTRTDSQGGVWVW